jgi:DNA polymerase-3 subunit delta
MAKSARKTNSRAALTWLKKPAAHPPCPVTIVFGSEAFLVGQVVAQIVEQVVGADDGEFARTTLSGTEALWRDVRDELDTVALFGGGRRIVVIEDADKFVSDYRSQLEQYVERPNPQSVLLLAVGTWPSNTRLFKAVDAAGLAIDCAIPSEGQLAKWLVERATSQYGRTLQPAAAEQLLELVEPRLGLLDQELAKLSNLVDDGESIGSELVEKTVGTWRTRTVWDMLDAALAGRTPEALRQLDRLLFAGEAPIAILGMISASLRRLAAATRLIEQSEGRGRRIRLNDALAEAGVKRWPKAMQQAEQQLRHLGRRRGNLLYRWLHDADLALKGPSSAPQRARIVLERLFVVLSVPADQVGLGRTPAAK